MFLLAKILRVGTLLSLAATLAACGSPDSSSNATATTVADITSSAAPTTVANAGPTTSGADPTIPPDPAMARVPEVAFISDGLGGFVGPQGIDDWSSSAESSEEFLGPWLHVSPGPQGSLWRSRLVMQSEDCAQLVLDISTLTSPNALDFAVALPYPAQPNCAQEVPWPAGYSDSFAVTDNGLVLLYLEQEPRVDCEAPPCTAEAVASVELRRSDQLDQVGIRFEVLRDPPDSDETDPAVAGLVFNSFARLGATSTDKGTLVVNGQAGSVLVYLDSAQVMEVPIGTIPAYDGKGYYYVDADVEADTVRYQPPSGDAADVMSQTDHAIELLADHREYLVLNLIGFEDSQLAYYDKQTGKMLLSGLGGLPGVQSAYIR